MGWIFIVKNIEGIIWIGARKMRKFNDFLNEQMNDDNFRKEYEGMQPELDVIRAIVDVRTSQNLTQKQLAECTGIYQADISLLNN